MRVNFSDRCGSIAPRSRHLLARRRPSDRERILHAACSATTGRPEPYSDADFYDLFGPTKTSRKGYAVSLGHTSTLVFDEPRRVTLEIEGRLSGNLDQLPEYQNVPVKVDRLFSLEANLQSSFLRSSLGHVDDEKGRLWSVVFRGDYVNSDVFTRLRATYDQGFALPVGHSSVWLRGAAGFSPQRADEPFANFFFGGFGNNYLVTRTSAALRVLAFRRRDQRIGGAAS